MVEFPTIGRLIFQKDTKKIMDRYGTDTGLRNLERLYNELLEKELEVERIVRVDREDGGDIGIFSVGKQMDKIVYIAMCCHLGTETISSIENSLFHNLDIFGVEAEGKSEHRILHLNFCLHNLEELSNRDGFMHEFGTEAGDVRCAIVEMPKSKKFALYQFLGLLTKAIESEKN